MTSLAFRYRWRPLCRDSLVYGTVNPLGVSRHTPASRLQGDNLGVRCFQWPLPDSKRARLRACGPSSAAVIGARSPTVYLLVQWSFPRVFIVLLARTLGRPFQRPCDAFAARRTLSQRGGGSRPSVASDAVDSRISWRRSDKEETERTVFGMALGRAVPPRARRGSRR